MDSRWQSKEIFRRNYKYRSIRSYWKARRIKLGLYHSNPTKTPMSATPLLIPNRSERPPNEDFNYLSVIGSQNSTRLCLCSWQSSSIFIEPWQLTYQSCEWVVSYLYHTRNHAITYYKDCNAMPNEPTAWEASSHPLDWKRTPAERLIFWRWCSNQTEYIRRKFFEWRTYQLVQSTTKVSSFIDSWIRNLCSNWRS